LTLSSKRITSKKSATAETQKLVGLPDETGQRRRSATPSVVVGTPNLSIAPPPYTLVVEMFLPVLAGGLNLRSGSAAAEP